MIKTKYCLRYLPLVVLAVALLAAAPLSAVEVRRPASTFQEQEQEQENDQEQESTGSDQEGDQETNEDQEPSPAEVILKEAQELVRKQEYALAIEKFNQSIAADPNLALAHYDLGFVYILQQKYAEAKQPIETAVRLKPEDADAHNMLGFVDFVLGDIEKSVGSFSQAIKLRPEFIRALRNRAAAYRILQETDASSADRKAIRDLLIRDKGEDGAVAQLMEWAEEYSYRNEYDLALFEFDEALLIQPEALSIHLEKIRTLNQLNLYAPAKAAAAELREKGHDDAELFFLEGNAHLLSGDVNGAIEFLRQAVDKDDQHAAAWNNLGECYSQLGDVENARNNYDKALALEPDNVQYRNNRGVLFMNNDQFEEALKDFEWIIANSIQPYVYAYVNRGRIRERQGSSQLALEDFSKAIEIAPTYDLPYFDRGEILYNLGEYQQAIPDLTKAVELDPSWTNAWFRLGLCHTQVSDTTKAIEAYSKTIELEDDFVAAYNNRGLAFADEGNWERAQVDWRRALTLDPINEFALRHMTDAFFETGQFEHAIQQASVLLGLDPSDIDMWNYRGDMWADLDNIEKAIVDYTRSLELDENQAMVWLVRGECHALLEQDAQAMADFNSALNLEKDWPRALEERADLYWNLGEYEKAKNDYLKMIEVDDELVYPYTALAWMLSTSPEEGVRDGEAAVKFATRANELLEWKNASALDDLACAYAEAGNFEMAVKYINQSIEIYNDQGEIPDEILNRRDLFLEGIPYHFGIDD